MLKFNSFRAQRYLRSKFVEGKYLLASEASDIELELIEALRRSVESTLGSEVAVEDAWKVQKLSATQLLVSPGEAWVKGLPVNFRSGKDQLVSGAILSEGIVPVGVTFSDDATGLGKIITFNNAATTPTNLYKINITIKEELLTEVDDPFLQNANLTEATAQKVRLIFQINVVPSSLQTESPIPYRDEASTSGSPTNYPNTGGSSAPNLVNQIVITPTAAGNGEQISLTPITGSEKIDGRDLEIVIRNDSGIGGGIILPNSPTAQLAFSNGSLIDSYGNRYHVNQIFNDTVSTQLVIRIDKEPDQPNPQLVNTLPYSLLKRDVYVTDDVNGSPQGKQYWNIADVDWHQVDGFVHESSITDLRKIVKKQDEFQEKTNSKFNLNLVNSGLISWDGATQFLTWASLFKFINPSGPDQTIAVGSAPLVDGGSLAYNLKLSAGGALENGTLAINVTAFGTTSSLSAVNLSNVKKGNVVVDSAGFVTYITSIDDINNTITTNSALTANGAATIYLDSFGPQYAPLSVDCVILAVRNGTKVYVRDLELETGESGNIGDGGISFENLNYIGAVSEADDSPLYSSTTYVNSGDSLTTAIGDLDAQLTVSSNNGNQDRTNKLVKGGTWNWNLAGNSLTWSASAFIQIAGLAEDVNELSAQSVTLSADGDVAYLQLKRIAGASVRTVSVGSISSLIVTNDIKIIARRVGTDVLVGESFLLKDGEYLELDGALAEINRLLGLLKLKEHESALNKIRVGVSESLLLDDAKLNQLIGDFLLKFDGAVINFSTGAVLKADDLTALGTNFTPFSVPVGEYFWYGISLTPNTVLADNRQEALVQVDPASAANASQNLAPKPNITGDIKLGAIQVFNNAGSIEVVQVVRLGTGSGSGSGAGTIKADYLDPLSTVLPTGVSVTIDGQAGVNDDLVLYTNLSSGNNRIYKLSGVGVSISWTPVRAFKGQFDPLDGDSVRILSGDSFQEQLAVFDGSDFKVNDVIRLFDGVSADFWELGSIKTTTLTNNTTANVFSVAVLGSENFSIEYSIVRNSLKRTGHLLITSDGTTAAITDTSAYIGQVGVTFSVAISLGNLILSYTTDNSGFSGTMKFFTKRWSDSPGGPTGIPSYSGAPPMGGGLTPNTEFRTLTIGEITAKQLTLAATPNNPAVALVDIIGGTSQMFSVDYTITGNILDWNGYALDGILLTGDRLRIHYFT